MNEKRMITGVLIDPEMGICEKRTVEDSLESFYAMLRCDLIDITERVVGHTPVSIICDDEGLLKDKPWGSAVSTSYGLYGYRPELVGALFVVGSGADEEGNLISLREGEASDVLNNVIWGASIQHPEPHPILTNLHFFVEEE